VEQEKRMYFNQKVLEEIKNHAVEMYPDECCGIITGNKKHQTVHRCQNIQNRLHAEDLERYPRDARTAYAIDRTEAEKIYSDANNKNEDVIAFYHSHTEHDAYFSDVDTEVQTVFGEPEFPDALHIVISVRGKKICDMKCFKWDGEKNNFGFIDGCI
jgi:proteasome lid subunit RPN8/RPN11